MKVLIIATAENAATVVRTERVSQMLVLPVMSSPSLALTSQKRKIATLEASEGCMPRIYAVLQKQDIIEAFFSSRNRCSSLLLSPVLVDPLDYLIAVCP